jgi:RNA polymerase sigma factor (sigma-70 family)
MYQTVLQPTLYTERKDRRCSMSNFNVLVVDDEKPLADAITTYLQRDRRDVEAAYDIASAQKRIREEDVDIVISDLRFSEEGAMDGIGLLEWAKDRNPDVEFIMMTGYGDTPTELQARKWGALRFFHKPLDLELLGDLVAYLEQKLISGEAEDLKIPEVPGTISETKARQLQRAYLTGEENALTTLLQGYRNLVFSVAMTWYNLNPEDAEDVYQDVSIEVMVKISRIKSLRPFIVGTTMNLSKKVLLKGRRWTSLPENEHELKSLLPEADQELNERDLRQALQKALDTLDPRHRQLVDLLFVQEISYKQLAETLHIPIGSIGPTRMKILKKLKRCLNVN